MASLQAPLLRSMFLPMLLVLSRNATADQEAVSQARVAQNSTDGERAKASLQLVPALVTATKGEVEHAYWLRRLYGAQVSAREAACARNGSALHAASGACAPLFEQGPCAPREWLLLDGASLRARCRPRPCAPGYGFLADEARCAPDAQLCARHAAAGRVFRYSLAGRGGCRCEGLRALGPDGACQPLYERAGCAQGQVLVPSYDRALGPSGGACVPAPCPQGHVQLDAAPASHARPPSAGGDAATVAVPTPSLGEQSADTTTPYTSLPGTPHPLPSSAPYDALSNYTNPAAAATHVAHTLIPPATLSNASTNDTHPSAAAFNSTNLSSTNASTNDTDTPTSAASNTTNPSSTNANTNDTDGPTAAASHTTLSSAGAGVADSIVPPPSERSASVAGAAGARCVAYPPVRCAARALPLLGAQADVRVPLCDLSRRALFVAPRRRERCLLDAAGRCLDVVVLSPAPFHWAVRPAARAPRPLAVAPPLLLVGALVSAFV